jgi:ribosome maturation factor RimP
MAEIQEQVQALVGPILQSMGLELWDIEFQRHGPQWLLRVSIDRPSGVTLEDCEAVSRDLGATLDVEDIIPHAYRLEVSSPGLDRSLTKPEHYARCAGSTVKIKTFRPVQDHKVVLGVLRGLGDDNIVRVEVEGGTVIEIPLENVAKASREVEF